MRSGRAGACSRLALPGGRIVDPRSTAGLPSHVTGKAAAIPRTIAVPMQRAAACRHRHGHARGPTYDVTASPVHHRESPAMSGVDRRPRLRHAGGLHSRMSTTHDPSRPRAPSATRIPAAAGGGGSMRGVQGRRCAGRRRDDLRARVSSRTWPIGCRGRQRSRRRTRRGRSGPHRAVAADTRASAGPLPRGDGEKAPCMPLRTAATAKKAARMLLGMATMAKKAASMPWKGAVTPPDAAAVAKKAAHAASDAAPLPRAVACMPPKAAAMPPDAAFVPRAAPALPRDAACEASEAPTWLVRSGVAGPATHRCAIAMEIAAAAFRASARSSMRSAPARGRSDGAQRSSTPDPPRPRRRDRLRGIRNRRRCRPRRAPCRRAPPSAPRGRPA